MNKREIEREIYLNNDEIDFRERQIKELEQKIKYLKDRIKYLKKKNTEYGKQLRNRK